jgi:arylsulfatase A-like enzyme
VAKKPRRARPASPLAALRHNKKTLGVALGVFAAAVFAAMILGARARHARTHAAPRATLDVLLISIGALRADAAGAYGSRTGATPWIDRLAAAGMRFETARAHSVLTLPSHATLLSGLYPPAHGVRDEEAHFPAGQRTLATVLKDRGYKTGAFVSTSALDARFGLDAGFDVYDDAVAGGGTASERPGARTVQAAWRWMQEQGDAPVFCFVHLHEPRSVAAADAALEPLLRPLLEAGKSGRTLVVLTSDHGEAPRDHAERTHTLPAREPMLRVPLLLFAPSVFGPAVARTPARHVDVLPTILDFLEIETPGGLAGASLRTLVVKGPGAAPPSYFEVPAGAGERGPRQGVVDQGWKYVAGPVPELYDLTTDPSETRNLAADRQDQVARLRGWLDGLRAAQASR